MLKMVNRNSMSNTRKAEAINWWNLLQADDLRLRIYISTAILI